MNAIRSFLAVLILLSAAALPAGETPAPRTILLLLSGDGGSPTGTLFVQGFREALPLVSDPLKSPFVVYVEFLDLNRFAGVAGYRERVRTAFHDKYASRHVDVIVTLFDAATLFALDARDSLWPSVPIVAGAVTPGAFDGVARPARFTGWPLQYDSRGLASVIHQSLPGTKTIVFISGAAPADRHFLHIARDSFKANAPEFAQVALDGLPLDRLLARLRSLPEDSVALLVTYLVDGNGRPIEFSSLAPLVSRSSSRPVLSISDTALGRGALAAHYVPTTEMGAFTCRIAQRVLAGDDLTRAPLFPPPRFQTTFDESEMLRWDIPESDLPDGAEVRWARPSIWRDHRVLVSVTVGLLVTLMGLVVGLFMERRRRINAQFESQQRFVVISAMNRRAALGELSASIAHEINQPLGAIMNNAEALRMMLSRPDPPLDELRAAVTAIRDDDRRASDIVRRIRKLVSRSDLDLQPLDLNEIVVGTLAIFGGDIRSRGIHLVTHLRDVPPVLADATHLQQVVLNVLMNALESMKNVDERVLFIRTFERDEYVGLTVTDSGAGFTDEALRRAFEPFFTTRSGHQGMGMGLAISRKIVEAHSGMIEASNNPVGRGAILTILLPRAGATDEDHADGQAHLAQPAAG